MYPISGGWFITCFCLMTNFISVELTLLERRASYVPIFTKKGYVCVCPADRGITLSSFFSMILFVVYHSFASDLAVHSDIDWYSRDLNTIVQMLKGILVELVSPNIWRVDLHPSTCISDKSFSTALK